MATSRDDFVIAIRSAFIKKANKQRFSLIALLFFSLILIFLSKLNFTPVNYIKSGLNEIIYRISFIVSLPEQNLNKSITTIKKHLNLYNNYEKLNSQVKKLEGQILNSDFLISENRRLRKLIDEYIIDSNELVAKILLDKNSPFLKSLIVNKGSKENVKIGMAVLDGPYLIGKVVEVNYATSRVLLVSDLNSKIPVVLQPDEIQSIMSGTGKNKGELQYLKSNVDLTGDKIIYTSGSGGIYKSGIPIGKLEQENKIEFFSDLTQLTFVKIVSFDRENK
mgnify:CR=1 FL=1